jgi:hypothetical protein
MFRFRMKIFLGLFFRNRLFRLLEIRQHPTAVEERLGGRVEPEVGEPALAWNGLDPVLFLSLGGIWSGPAHSIDWS